MIPHLNRDGVYTRRGFCAFAVRYMHVVNCCNAKLEEANLTDILYILRQIKFLYADWSFGTCSK